MEKREKKFRFFAMPEWGTQFTMSLPFGGSKVKFFRKVFCRLVFVSEFVPIDRNFFLCCSLRRHSDIVSKRDFRHFMANKRPFVDFCTRRRALKTMAFNITSSNYQHTDNLEKTSLIMRDWTKDPGIFFRTQIAFFTPPKCLQIFALNFRLNSR